MSPAGLIVVAVFGAAALLALGGAGIAWPLLRDGTHRKRMLALFALLIAAATCLVIGQKLLDDVVCHTRLHDQVKASH